MGYFRPVANAPQCNYHCTPKTSEDTGAGGGGAHGREPQQHCGLPPASQHPSHLSSGCRAPSVEGQSMGKPGCYCSPWLYNVTELHTGTHTQRNKKKRPCSSGQGNIPRRMCHHTVQNYALLDGSDGKGVPRGEFAHTATI